MKDVLLVDDSTIILMSVGDILKKMGLTVKTAKDGQSALNELNNGYKPVVIITDYNMPNMNGVELITEIRKLPSFKFTPIMMLTTESQSGTREQGKRAGATAWLVKPISAPDLHDVMKRVIPTL